MTNLGRLKACWKWCVSVFRAGSSTDIRPQGQFRALIVRERIRADRNQHLFSLLLFSIGADTNSIRVQHLARVLADRVRLTDEVGWFDDEHVGVVLPYTSAAGAQRLANDIYEAIATRASSLKCSIYTYPSNWFSNGKSNSAQLHFADLFPEWNVTKSPWLSACAMHDGRENMFASEELPHNTTSNYPALAESLEATFVRPLPVWKRDVDIVGALLGLVVLSPLLILVTLMIKIVSPGPVLLKQPRVGYMGRTFRMLKFRTMRADTDTSQHQRHVANLVKGQKPMAKLANGPHIIPLGNALRISCLDELPQLINVLCGDMSLVGPRPDVPYICQYYTHWRKERFHAIPGMTGLWQVSGKNNMTFDAMIRLDIDYLRHITFWLDLKIMFKTVPAILTQIKYSLSVRNSKDGKDAESS